MRRLLLVSILTLAAAALWPGAQALAASSALGDFNGDGAADLAVGVPLEDLPAQSGPPPTDAGAVNVLYGASGLATGSHQLWHQDSPGVLGDAHPGDRFGTALAAGDFNGDGWADLAVGVPGEETDVPTGDVGFAGAVSVLYGSASGLSATGNQIWSQDHPGVLGEPDFGDSFGAALAAGEFNGDGRADLAVGVPFEDVPNPDLTVQDAGAVNVLYGSASRLTAFGNQLWHQDVAGIADPAEASDNFGSSLNAGDFNGNGRIDLAVGVPGEDLGAIGDAGAVNVLYGAAGRIEATGNQLWHQNSGAVLDAAEESDRFGFALAAGDFNGNGRVDLAVGAPGEDVGAIGDAGAVNVLYGTASRLVGAGNQFWHQDSAGVLEAAEDFDEFGTTMAAGDFNGNGRDDLTVGVPFESVGPLLSAGALNLLYGSASALSATGNQLWHQNSPGVSDVAEASDTFGAALAAGDLNDNGRDDLAVGAPFENIGTTSNAGALNVLYGASPALSASGSQFLHQNSPGIPDAAEPDDHFGSALASGGKAP